MPTFGIQWGGSDFLMLDFIADLKKQYPNHIVLVRGYGPGRYFYYGYDFDADIINKVLKYKIVDFGSFYRAGGSNLGKMKNVLLTRGYSVVVYVKDHVASVTTPASFRAEKAKIAAAKKQNGQHMFQFRMHIRQESFLRGKRVKAENGKMVCGYQDCRHPE